MISLTDQLTCARAVLAQMQAKESKWIEAQAAIVQTVERALGLEQMSHRIVGRKTGQVPIEGNEQ